MLFIGLYTYKGTTLRVFLNARKNLSPINSIISETNSSVYSYHQHSKAATKSFNPKIWVIMFPRALTAPALKCIPTHPVAWCAAADAPPPPLKSTRLLGTHTLRFTQKRSQNRALFQLNSFRYSSSLRRHYFFNFCALQTPQKNWFSNYVKKLMSFSMATNLITPLPDLPNQLLVLKTHDCLRFPCNHWFECFMVDLDSN
jgi:hypothetical protein